MLGDIEKFIGVKMAEKGGRFEEAFKVSVKPSDSSPSKTISVFGCNFKDDIWTVVNESKPFKAGDVLQCPVHMEALDVSAGVEEFYNSVFKSEETTCLRFGFIDCRGVGAEELYKLLLSLVRTDADGYVLVNLEVIKLDEQLATLLTSIWLNQMLLLSLKIKAFSQ